jgi:hypothetical protein
MRFKLITSIILSSIALSFCKGSSLCAIESNANSVPLIQKQGVDMFMQSQYREAYWPLSQYYELQQKNHCGIASAVMVLNALQISRPQVWAGSPFNLFTQDNFFSDAVCKYINKKEVETNGVSLADLALAMETWGVNVKTIYADTLTVNTFRDLLKGYLVKTDRFIIANYNRNVIQNSGGGHISPIAAYDQETDSVLIMDVYRCRFTGTWVKLPQLLAAMQAVESSSVIRGLLLVHLP